MSAPTEDKPKLFSQYCYGVIQARQRGDLSLENAGYRIAETTFSRELDEPLFQDITSVAGGLELPGHVLGADPEQQWRVLYQLVDE